MSLLIPFGNNDTLQKWHIRKNPPETDKYDTHKNGSVQKWHTLRKNAQRLPCLSRTELRDF